MVIWSDLTRPVCLKMETKQNQKSNICGFNAQVQKNTFLKVCLTVNNS